jgi:hypothetical protein
MSTGFLSRMLSVCQHQFAWPRRDEHGDYYQLCVNCGSKYGYDWTKMCRTAKLSNDSPIEENGARTHFDRKVAWVPRERRLHYQVPMHVRVYRSEEWQQASSENISRSGLLFRCAMPLQEGQSLELKLDMPKELTGETSAQVLCRGLVARITEVPVKGKENQAYLVACSILDYEFTSKPISKATVQSLNVIGFKKRQSTG